MLVGMTQQAERPLGFATPHAAPLSVAAPRAQISPNGGPAPQDFAAPEQDVVPLAAIAPAPPETRDPTQPYLGDAEPVVTSDWRPDQPLLGSNLQVADPPAMVDPRTLPPPTGAPTAAAPTGLAPGPYPGSAYPANQYATGPYSGSMQYPPPYGTGWGTPRLTFVQVVMRANPWVLGLLAAGFLWDTIAPYALVAALIVSLVVRSPGRVALAVAAGFAIAVGLLYYTGWIGSGQWLSTSSLLGLLCLGGVLLITYNTLRRRG